MREKVAQLNGSIDESNIRCCRCTHRAGGGFSPDAGIRICANEIINRKHMEDTLSHELIHAYDHLRFKVDFENLRHAACAEVRRPRHLPLKRRVDAVDCSADLPSNRSELRA